MAAPIRIVPRDEIARGTGDPPRIRLPARASVFSDRASRLRVLASRAGAGGAFLAFCATIADAQQRALDGHAPVVPPSDDRLELARTHRLPPLGTDGERDPAWRAVLASIVANVTPAAPAAMRDALGRLAEASPARLEEAASELLDGNLPGIDPAEAPILAAALQVHWVKRASDLGVGAFVELDVPNVCPVCGSPAVASVLRVDVPAPGTRYLHCALCAAEWYLPRGQCTFCEEREHVAYLHPEGTSEAVKAEACDDCKTYLKIVSAEKDPLVDPVADDLATIALDVALDEVGYERGGPNLMIVAGSP